MNFRQLIQGLFLSLVFIFVVGFFWWGMQWFSNSLENFFQFKLSSERNEFLSSVSDIILSNNAKNSALQELPFRDPNIPDLQIEVASAVSQQTNLLNREKNLFKKSGEEQMPIASLTKLMTAVIVAENYDLAARVQISKEAEIQGGALKAGEVYTASDLLRAMLVESNNAAAFALSEILGTDKFIKMMNLKANEIGLKNTYFSSPTGEASTNYSTMDDLVNLAKYLLSGNRQILQITAVPEFDLYDANGVLRHKVASTNELLRDLDLKDRIIGGKTGYTKDAGECLFLILKAPDENSYLINVVLNAKNRFVEMKKMINWEDIAYKWK